MEKLNNKHEENILRMGKRKIVSEPDELEQMMEPGPGDVYGVVVKMYGYDRVLVECSDGKTRLCRIRGQLKRRIWIKEGDLVLVSPWDFQSDKRGDIWWRFTKGQALKLAEQGVLPDFLKAKVSE
jgi:translation initiation factor 1A